MNKVILIGRLAADPEVRYSQGENATAIARYRLAVDRRYKREGEQTADFISCVAFGKNGEFVEKYLHKGTKIAISGRIQTGSYTNKDGQKEQTADFISCVAFGKNGEFVEKYLHKGTKIAISGRIQTGSYTNKDGQKIYTTDVVVEEHEFCESKSAGSATGASPYGQADENGFMNIPDGIDEELPFS